MSRFNSTQDTTWFKQNKNSKRGMEGKTTVPPKYSYQ